MADLLAYCKLTELADDPEVQALVPALYEAAVGYMAGAGIAPPPPGTPRAAMYDLCVSAMVLNGWDFREAAATAAVTDNPVFRSYINQLKRTEPPAAEGGGRIG